MSQSEYGAWIPQSIVERLAKVRLRPASRWQVFVLLLCTSCRFGYREARLSIVEIAAKTGLSERTVKSSLRDLIHAGLVRRVGRYRKLVVTLLPPPSVVRTEVVELPLPRTTG